MRLLVLAAALALAACVPAGRPPAPGPVRAPPSTALAPPLPADWRDWPVTTGNWRYAGQESGRSVATYGGLSPDFVVELVCDARDRQITLSIAASSGTPSLTVRTSTALRTMPAISMGRADGRPPVTWDVRLVPTDTLLDAMAFSRGRFTVEVQGQTPLVIPAWPEIGRVIEDCRG